MKKYFFDDVLEAIIYVIFLCIIPFFSIIAQFMVSDKTMYVSYIVAGFSMTYDYLMLFKKNVCFRLWIESVFALLCLILTEGIGIISLFLILLEEKTLPYLWSDLYIVLILAIMLIINIIELCMLLYSDYKKKYRESDNSNSSKLINGALKV